MTFICNCKCSIRKAEALWVIQNKGFILWIRLYTVWELVKMHVDTASGMGPRSLYIISWEENIIWRVGEGRQTGLHMGLSLPPSLIMSMTHRRSSAPKLHLCLVSDPGVREAGAGNAVAAPLSFLQHKGRPLDQQQCVQAAVTPYTLYQPANSLKTNPKPAVYMEGCSGKCSSSDYVADAQYQHSYKTQAWAPKGWFATIESSQKQMPVHEFPKVLDTRAESLEWVANASKKFRLTSLKKDRCSFGCVTF